MTLNTVTLTWDLTDLLQAGIRATLSLTPNAVLTDATNHLVIPEVQRSAQFVNGTGSLAGIIACDNSTILPSGWAYTLTVSVLGQGQLLKQTVQINFANGATQDLSALIPLSPAPGLVGYLPLPSGTPQAGSVPIATGTGEASAWGPQSGGGGFSNPMTTLGDLIYENATPAAARLAGDTSNTRKFLRTQASGGVAQAPAWDTIQAGDVPTLNQNTTGTAAGLSATLAIGSGGTGQTTQQAAIDALAGAVTSGQVLRGNGTHVQLAALAVTDLPSLATTFTFGSSGAVPSSGSHVAGQVLADQNGVVRVCTAGGTPGTWARAGAQPSQFWVDDYGAKGDGKIVGDAAMTSGTATLTSATAGFTSGDVGKNIVVNGALGNSSAPLYTTILSVINSTTAVLNANATSTISSAAAFWASDDSAAIVLAINAASTYAQANLFKAQVIFQAKSYGLATLTTTTAGGSLANQNALVPIPYPNVNGTTQKLSFELIGVGENADQQYFNSTIPCMSGTCLVATVAASGTNPSIIGGPYDSANLSGTWANTKAVIKGISVWAGWNPGWIAFGLNQLSACWVDDACAQVLAPQAAGQAPIATTIPSNGSGVGLWMPANNDAGAGRFLEMGYYKGVNLSTRNTIEKLFTSASVHGALAQTVNGSVIHGARIGYWACQGVTNGLSSLGISGTMALVVDLMDTTSTVTTDLNDPHGTLVGNVNWYHDVSTAPNVAAGFAMKITNLRQPPGYWSGAPAVPSSTTAQQNTAWRDAYVIITGGTVSDITVDGHSTGLTSGMVMVPSGKTITITYTVAPTWNWWLI